MVLKGKSGDVAMKGLKVCVYLLILYSKIAIYSRKEHLHRKKSRTSRDRPDGTTHTSASLETHNQRAQQNLVSRKTNDVNMVWVSQLVIEVSHLIS